MPDDKKIEDMSDEEFDKLSEEGDAKAEPKEEEKEPEKVEAPEEEEEEKKEEEEADVDDNVDDVDDEAPQRTPHIPYTKHKKAKEKWEGVKNSLEEENAGLKDTIEDLKTKITKSVSAGDMDKDIEEFASKSNLDKDTVIGLANIIKKHSGIDEKMAKKMEQFDDLQNKIEGDNKFEEEYNEKAVPGFESINPNATSAQLKKAKARLTELAYEKKYLKVPLEMIVSHFKDEFSGILGESVKKKTMEGKSRPKSVSSEIADEDLTPEDWKSMSDEEFDKRSDRLAEQSPSQNKITRKGEQIN